MSERTFVDQRPGCMASRQNRQIDWRKLADNSKNDTIMKPLCCGLATSMRMHVAWTCVFHVDASLR